MILGRLVRPIIILNINLIKIKEDLILAHINNNHFSFIDQIETLCKAASYKLHTLRRIRKYLNVDKARLLCSAFINSQFNYECVTLTISYHPYFLCISLVWGMLH